MGVPVVSQAGQSGDPEILHLGASIYVQDVKFHEKSPSIRLTTEGKVKKG